MIMPPSSILSLTFYCVKCYGFNTLTLSGKEGITIARLHKAAVARDLPNHKIQES
jgi:hypothetical protein